VTHPRDLETVTRKGLCAGCGLCASMLGPNVVEMRINAAGNIRPFVKREPQADLLRRVLSVCPGSEVALSTPNCDVPIHRIWGRVSELHRVWARNGRVRYKAAAGGALTALGCYLLGAGAVDAILHVKANREHPLLTDAVVSYTENEVIEASQSRYGPAAPLTHVMALLEGGIRFAVIAKPCDISAVRSLSKLDDRARRLIPYLLTMFCGGIHHIAIPRKIIDYHGVVENDVTTFRYRGEGWPGPTTVEARDGQRFDLSYEETWFDENKPWKFELQFRCKICPDHIGEQSDIAIADGWLLEGAKPVYREADGVNVALVRTDAGRTLLRQAADAGYVTLAPMSFEELDLMHPEQIDWKVSNPAKQLAMAVTRQPRLTIHDARTRAVIKSVGPMRLAKAFFGTIFRIGRGDNREPLEPEVPG
jgi:coenzyme F420 hydrogenase subunit beta